LSTRPATGGFGAVPIYAGRDRTSEDGQIFGRPDPLSEQLQLTLHLVKTT
jgi:hypothetical protein